MTKQVASITLLILLFAIFMGVTGCKKSEVVDPVDPIDPVLTAAQEAFQGLKFTFHVEKIGNFTVSNPHEESGNTSISDGGAFMVSTATFLRAELSGTTLYIWSRITIPPVQGEHSGFTLYVRSSFYFLDNGTETRTDDTYVSWNTSVGTSEGTMNYVGEQNWSTLTKL